jgi:hypothetical protein
MFQFNDYGNAETFNPPHTVLANHFGGLVNFDRLNQSPNLSNQPTGLSETVDPVCKMNIPETLLCK